MKETPELQEHTAQAILALSATRQPLTYEAPSEEELAALLEAGFSAKTVPGMDSTRKAQVIDAIANDSATFSRWMALVDAAETLELAGFGSEQKAANTSQQKSSVNWLKSLFSNPLRGLATGGGMVAASALMLMVTTSDDYQAQIDQLYGAYGESWSSMPAKQTVTRSTTSPFKHALSAEDSALHAGVTAGLNKLEDDFSLLNLAEKSSLSGTDSLDETLAEHLNIAGQLAALSHFKCSLGANPAYFTETVILLEELEPAFLAATDETSKALSSTLQRKGSTETKVCRFSKQVISRVSR